MFYVRQNTEGGNTMKNFIKRLFHVLRGDSVILTVHEDTLIVDAGNKSAEDVKNIASTFFKKAYTLSNK